MQTDAAAAARGAARTLLHISRHEGLGALYKGLAPIAMRQVPYTMSKLVVYDQVARLAKSACVGEREHLRPCAIVLTGLVAGAAAAIVSHPADLLLTRLCGSATASTATTCTTSKATTDTANVASTDTGNPGQDGYYGHGHGG